MGIRLLTINPSNLRDITWSDPRIQLQKHQVQCKMVFLLEARWHECTSQGERSIQVVYNLTNSAVAQMVDKRYTPK